MKMNELIKTKYGSVDKMIESANLTITRSYVYQLINKERDNITMKVAKELQNALDLNSIDEVIELLNDNEEV